MRTIKSIGIVFLMALILTGWAEASKCVFHHDVSGTTPIVTNIQEWVENYNVVPIGIVTFGVSNKCVFVSDGTNAYVIARTWDAVDIGLETITNRYGIKLSESQSFDSLGITNVPVARFIYQSENAGKQFVLTKANIVNIGDSNDISNCEYGLVCGSNCTITTFASAYGKSCSSMASYSSSEGVENYAAATNSHAEGEWNTICDTASESHIEGNSNIAESQKSHAEGEANCVVGSGWNTHAEGFGNDVNSTGHNSGRESCHCAGIENSITVNVASWWNGNNFLSVEGSGNIVIRYGLLNGHIEGVGNTLTNWYSGVCGGWNTHILGFDNVISQDDCSVYGTKHSLDADSSHISWEDIPLCYTTALGVGCKSKKKKEVSFVYNGDKTLSETKYKEPAESAFSVNPVGGTNGFYVGKTPIGAIVSPKLEEKIDEELIAGLLTSHGGAFNQCLRRVILLLGGSAYTRGWEWN